LHKSTTWITSLPTPQDFRGLHAVIYVWVAIDKPKKIPSDESESRDHYKDDEEEPPTRPRVYV